MITWAELRSQVRFLLKDVEPTKYRSTDADLAQCMGWALDALCAHTCVLTATGFVLDPNFQAYTLPNNVYEPLDKAGMVYIDNGGEREILEPIPFYNFIKARRGFYLLPENVINLIEKNKTGTLNVIYYAKYNHPVFPTDEMNIPPWAEAALCYRAAAYALSPFTKGIASIRQYGQQPDTGAPEQNPLLEIARNYLRMYESELALYPTQRRELMSR